MIDIIIATSRTREEVKPQVEEIETNTPESHRIIATCQPLSAAKNRNFGLSFANSDLIVMLDDDIIGFYSGWLTTFISFMQEDKNIVLSSARLLDKNGHCNNNMGMNVPVNETYSEIKSSFVVKNIFYKRITTACICFRKSKIRFDETFQGSGFEDTCFMNQISEKFNGMKFIVNNKCKLIHLNEMKGQGNKEIWEFNHTHYCKKYPWDTVAQNQKWWFHN
ncbi:MAG: glycosyltransferase family 2 protein [Candidatus Hodarchaeota archaeon]